VDYDPVVIAHARALLANDKNVQVIESDVRHPRQVIGQIAESSDLIDLSAPVGVLMLAVLHFITDAEDPWGVAGTFKNVMARGSYLALSHITDDGMDPVVAKAAQDIYAGASAPAVPRGHAEILRFFDGMELIPRGLVHVNAWPFADDDRELNPRTLMYGGVARKS
jgi:S-adenosyl methyltransferase